MACGPRNGPDSFRRRAIGSAGERLVHTEEVTGSIPVSPTQLKGRFRLRNRPFVILVQQQSVQQSRRMSVAQQRRYPV